MNPESGILYSGCTALITAAGASSRMGSGVKKELELIDGIPVITRAVQAFASLAVFETIAVTYAEAWKTRIEAALEGIDGVILIEGGASRQESIYKALLVLRKTPPNHILIHDGSRPWVSSGLIMNVLDGTIEHGACIPVVPATEALKRLDENGAISAHQDRSVFYNAQTPQGFSFRKILSAHEAARKNGADYTDDAEAYHHAVGPVYTVPGDPENRKITYRYHLP